MELLLLPLLLLLLIIIIILLMIVMMMMMMMMMMLCYSFKIYEVSLYKDAEALSYLLIDYCYLLMLIG